LPYNFVEIFNSEATLLRNVRVYVTVDPPSEFLAALRLVGFRFVSYLMNFAMLAQFLKNI